MPYIKNETRERFEWAFPNPATNAGELNYLFTRVINDYLSTHELKYTIINDVVGALEGAKLEFYRRVAVPYEQKKIEENGDLY